jgi:hypothetical protein
MRSLSRDDIGVDRYANEWCGLVEASTIGGLGRYFVDFGIA